MARVPGGFGVNDVRGVRSRPSRVVSLGDVREQPVQRMGGLEEFLFWSRENPRPRGMAEPRDVSKLSARARAWVESMGFDIDDLHEPMADDLEDMAEAEVAEGDSEAEFDRRQTERTGQIAEEIVRDRRQQVEDAEAAEEAWKDAERDASVGDPEWDGFPVEEMRGLTADEAFRLHHAMAGGGQESLPGLSPEEIQAEINRRGIAEGREILGPPRTPEEQVAYERELKRRNSPPRPVVEPPPLPPASEARRESLADRLRGTLAGYDPGRSYNGAPSLDAVGRAATSMLTSAGSTGHLGGPGQPFGSDPYRAPRGSRRDPGNPQSQMSQQFLADRFAQQAAQPQQGYFGGLGEAVGGMSTEQKIALLVGLGLLTGGTSTPLMAPALGVGAGLAFTQ